MIEQAPGDDMTALDEPHAVLRAATERVVQQLADPRARRVRDRAGAHVDAGAAGALQLRMPFAARADRADELRAREHGGAALAGVQRVEHHEARIVDPAVGINEAAPDRIDERCAGRMAAHIDAARAGQQLAPSKVVVQEQTGADEPGRAQIGHVRHHEAQRPHDVRCGPQQRFALLKRLAHKAEFLVLEIPKPAVDEFGARRRRVRGQVVLFDQQHGQAAPRGVTRDARAIDPAAHHEQIVSAALRHLAVPSYALRLSTE